MVANLPLLIALGSQANERCNVQAPLLSQTERERGSHFAPKFDNSGLLSAVVVDYASGEVLVVAFMNAEALSATLATRRVHFWSRSRAALWMKGESSGHVLDVVEVLVDCDQDALVIRATARGPTCHTGARSCFYRRVELDAGGSPVLTQRPDCVLP
jgi:phosphoribosyl-AMP cyclohydrolase